MVLILLELNIKIYWHAVLVVIQKAKKKKNFKTFINGEEKLENTIL